MKQLLLAAGLLLAAATAHAQARFGIGPQGSYTLFTTDYHDASISTGYHSGFAAGLTADFGVGHLLVRSAVLYTQKGYTLNQSLIQAFSGNTLPGSSAVRVDYFTVPLSLGYTQRRDGQGVQVFAGAYLGFLKGGRYYTTVAPPGQSPPDTSGPVISDKDSFTAGGLVQRRLDWGLQFGAGYRRRQLLLLAEYSIGLQNVDPNNLFSAYGESATYHNRGFQFSLAYLFNLSGK